MSEQSEALVRTRVWDAPTRLFHWLLVFLFAGAWWTAENDHADLHLALGCAIAALLAFRLFWGFVGADTARFSHFVRSPPAALSYLRALLAHKSEDKPGHSALGGWSVIAMLALLIVQVATGLFAVDIDGINSGPLSRFVDYDAGRAASRAHHLSFNLLLALIGLHLAAIAFYALYARRNLIGAMITGRRAMPAGTPAKFAPLWVAGLGALAAGAFGWLLFTGFKF